MPEPLVSIQVVVYNGEKYIRNCLASVRSQTYQNIEVVILDNHSSDATREIIKNNFPEYELISSEENLGMWPGQEKILANTKGKYVLVLSVDVILDKEFVARAVQECEQDETVDALQPKVYQYNLADFTRVGDTALRQDVIDTCGFTLTRGRKVVNIGHGQKDKGQFRACTVFGVEGAVPFFRRSALEDVRVDGELIDHDYFWYGDDLDLAWRLTLFGHKQMFVPDVIAWHDRSTTKETASLPIIGQLRKIHTRRLVPMMKRRLDWSNVRFTIIKNDYIINCLRDSIYIASRELAVLAYTLIFEPAVLAEIGRFFRLLPRMIKRRKLVMSRAKIGADNIHRYFI